VSHLIQSTRAGADYGYNLLWIILLANLFKYPFFEYGSRYANATGKSIIDGYKKLGTWALWIYFVITIGSMFFVAAAVGAVTAGFMDNLFGLSGIVASPFFAITLIFLICGGILAFGKFSVLDKLVKVIGITLLLTTVLAFVLTLAHGQNPADPGFVPKPVWFSDDAGILFVIALMGWMPTALDLSTWNSLWTVARIKQTGYHPKLKETLFDFNFGYITSALLSICFVTLGAMLLYGSTEALPDKSAPFANTVINLYTETIGDWSYYIIAISAFSIMFGTCIAVFDGYSRAISRTVFLLRAKTVSENEGESGGDRSTYLYGLLAVMVGAFGIIYFFGGSLKFLVDVAMTISFLIAPFVAIANYTLVQEKYVGKDHVPPMWMKVLSILGIIFLTGFSVFFIVSKFI